MDNVVGRNFVNEILAEKVDNGDWKVTVSTIEKRKIDGQDWEEKKISTSCTDKEFDSAYEVAFTATFGKFNDTLKENNGYSLFPDEPTRDELEGKTLPETDLPTPDGA